MKDDIKNALSSAKVLSEKEIKSIAETGLSNKNVIVDVFDCYAYDKESRLLMKSENLTESGITASADQEEIRNGKGNRVFAIINKNKNLEVSLTENVFDFSALAYKNGTKVVTGSGVITVPTQKELEVNEDLAITLTKTPIKPSMVVCSKKGKVVSGAYSNGKITFEAPIVKGDLIDVEPYETAVSNVEKIIIKAEEFPSANRLVLHTVELDKDMRHVANIFIIMDRATPNGAWEINPGSERQPVNSAYTFKVAANEKGELATILRETV